MHGNDYISFDELSARNPEAAEHGDADFYLLQSDFVARYALGNLSELLAAIPFKSIRLRVDNNDEHHRNETTSGIGDLRLGGKRYLISNDSVQLAGLVGLNVPTGKLNNTAATSYLGHEEAADLGIDVPAHNHAQLGTGTFYPFIGFDSLFHLDQRWMLLGSIQAELPFYKNKYGYKTSTSGTFSLGPALRVESMRSVFSLFAEAFYSGRDHFSDETIEGTNGSVGGDFWVPNTGRFEVALKPGVTWNVSPKITLNLRGRIAIYTQIRTESAGRDVQLSEPFGLLMSITLTPR